MRPLHLARVATVALLALGSLSGCSTWSSMVAYVRSDPAALCPDASILTSTASLPAFDPAAGADPASVIYSVALTDIKAKCDYDKRERTTDSRLVITFRGTRPPGGRGAHYRVPYYVAVATGGDVLDKKIYWLDLAFDEGAAAAVVQDTVESTVVVLPKGKQVYDYHLIVGFQLTKAQLDYNKKMGSFAP